MQSLVYLRYLLLFGFFFHASTEYSVYRNKLTRKIYDYIVVGGGSSGAVVASRLSEDPSASVLLLEAGGVPPIATEVPLILGKIPDMPGLDWNYYTEPQEKACLGLKEKRSYWPRGKGLGGCSMHNYMLYTRGNHKDYDDWEKQGAHGWSWKDVLPFFIKSENNTDPSIANNGFHGTKGPLTVSPLQYKSKLNAAYLEAGKHLGYDIVDYNGASQLGFSAVQVTQRDGLRCSTEKAFLRPAAGRSNLDILVNSRVTKIQFDADKRARYVIFERESNTHSVEVSREIVLSAGAIGSPQILLLSGVGPRDHLASMGIPLVADLPVGENLQDHIIAGGMHFLLDQPIGIVKSRDVTEDSTAELLSGKGPFTSPATLETMVFVNTKYQNAEEKWPDIQIEISASLVIVSMPEFADKDATTFLTTLLRPKSRGFLKLKSSDPHDDPIMDPKYLTHEDDLNTLVEGMKISLSILETPQLRKFSPKHVPGANAGCDTYGSNLNNTDYLACLARTFTYTDYHPCGTCKMGDPWDPTTVLDPQLKVKGIKGLRVADASIMPSIVSGNTNAPCIMIGEKAADLIQKEWARTTNK